MSDNGLKAEREPQAPSRLPAKLYSISRNDANKLADLLPSVRSRLLRYLDYPALFDGAASRGFELPSIENVSSMDATRFVEFWGLAAEANRSDTSQADPAPEVSPPLPVEPAHAIDSAFFNPAVATAAATTVATAPTMPVTPPLDVAATQRLSASLDVDHRDPNESASSSAGSSNAHGAATANGAGLSRSQAFAEGSFPELLEHVHTSLMARYLKRDMYESLRDVRTALSAFSFDQAIAPGVRRPESVVGIVAADVDSYDRFAPLLDKVIEEWHGWSRSRPGKLDAHKSDTDANKLEFSSSLGMANEASASSAHSASTASRAAETPSDLVRVALSRNLSEHAFLPAMGIDDFAEVERVLLLALRSLPNDGEQRDRMT